MTSDFFGLSENQSRCYDTFRSGIPCQDYHGNEAHRANIVIVRNF